MYVILCHVTIIIMRFALRQIVTPNQFLFHPQVTFYTDVTTYLSKIHIIINNFIV